MNASWLQNAKLLTQNKKQFVRNGIRC